MSVFEIWQNIGRISVYTLKETRKFLLKIKASKSRGVKSQCEEIYLNFLKYKEIWSAPLSTQKFETSFVHFPDSHILKLDWLIGCKTAHFQPESAAQVTEHTYS